MEVEQDRIARLREELRKERQFRYDVIKKAEVYERLKSNRDFNEFLQDIRHRVEAHKTCVDTYAAALGQPVDEKNEQEHPLLRRLRCADLIAFHEAQKAVCADIAGMVDTVTSMKEDAMNRLNEIERQEKELPNGPTQVI